MIFMNEFHWCSLAIGVIWLLVVVTIVQIGYNIYNNTEHHTKVLAITTGAGVIWTIAALVVNGLLYKFLPKIIGLVDTFFTYVFKFLPYKIIFWWFALWAIVAYVVFLAMGITQYMKKRKNYMDWRKHQMEGSTKQTKKEPTLSAKQTTELDGMLTDKDIKSALLFRKMLKTAQRHPDQIAGVKVDNDYWIPIVNTDQFDKIRKVVKPLADEIKADELDYPLVASIGKTHVDIKTSIEAQDDFKQYLEKKSGGDK